MPTNLPDLRLGLRQINTGNAPNDGLGDDLRTAFDKFNFNMNVLSSTVNESLVSTKIYWVAGTGSDTANNGLQESTPFKTIGKAVKTVYEQLNLRGQQAIINVLPGDFVESVSINSIPDGGFINVPLLIRKAPGQAGAVFWSLNTATMDYCLRINNGASVQLENIQFRTLATGADNKNYVQVLNNSTLYIGACEFNLLGASSLTGAFQVLVEGYSEVQLVKPYTINGGGTSHIYLKDGSYLWSPATDISPKIVTVAGTVEFQEVFRLSGRSDMRLEDTRIQYQGNLQAQKYRSDFFSRPELGISVLPGSTTAQINDSVNLWGEATFNNRLTSATNLTSLGTSTFQGSSTFNGSTTFSGAATFTNAVTFAGNTLAVTPEVTDNSTKVATTNFVQEVVEDKIIDSLAIATPALFGLVKIDSPASDPVVYLKPSVDTLLGAKANLADPIFTGNPQAPTPSSGSNSTSIATTAWVRTHSAAISAVPVGTVVPFAGLATNVPAGWLLCNGSYISRTTYAALFGVIGTQWGTTDSSNFRLPNLVDRMVLGATNDGNVGVIAGSATCTLATANLPAHNHNVLDPGHTHTINDPGHSHSYSDPGHIHVVNDPGHQHVVDTQKVFLGSFEPNLTWNDTGSLITLVAENAIASPAGTGIFLDRAWTGITIIGNQTNVTANASGTGITTQNTGSGTPVNVLNPHSRMHYIIKT